MREPEQIVARGIVAGLVGATILAVWFLIIDTLQGQPFFTPAFIASVLAEVNGIDRSLGLIAMYTALHYAAFLLIGLGVAWVISRLEAVPGILLGLVLGFLLFDVIFYFGVLFTGVDVVQELGWPQVLFGNLIAGIGVMGYLRLSMALPSVTWWQTLAEHRIVREGIIAGLIGATVVAVWFLIFDLTNGGIFFTPGALGSALFVQARDLSAVQVNLLTVGGYTVVHFGAFIVAGLVAAALCVEAEKTPPVVLGALLLFFAFEAFFVGMLVIVAEWLLGTLAWWTIAGGNLLATFSMAYYLWRTHPRLRMALGEKAFS